MPRTKQLSGGVVLMDSTTSCGSARRLLCKDKWCKLPGVHRSAVSCEYTDKESPLT